VLHERANLWLQNKPSYVQYIASYQLIVYHLGKFHKVSFGFFNFIEAFEILILLVICFVISFMSSFCLIT